MNNNKLRSAAEAASKAKANNEPGSRWHHVEVDGDELLAILDHVTALEEANAAGKTAIGLMRLGNSTSVGDGYAYYRARMKEIYPELEALLDELETRGPRDE